MWRHLPNVITAMRMALVWPVFWLISRGDFGLALLLAAIAGISDAADGWLAKHFSWQSRLGGLLDPLADKMMLIVSFVVLTIVGAIPLWLTLLIVGISGISLAIIAGRRKRS